MAATAEYGVLLDTLRKRSIEELEFALMFEPDNQIIRARLDHVRELSERNAPTVPSSIALEKATNPFLRAARRTVKRAVGMPGASDVEVFAELRRRKDTF